MTTSRGPHDAWHPGAQDSTHPVPGYRPPPSVPHNPAQAVPAADNNVRRLRPDPGNYPPPATPQHGVNTHPHAAHHPAYRPDTYASQHTGSLTNANDRLVAPQTRGRGIAGLLRRWGVGKKALLAELDAALIESIQTPLAPGMKVVFACAKGGVAKTVHTVAVGNILAEYRKSRHPSVAAIDFNPDHGTLGVRSVPRSHAAPGTIRALIDHIAEYGGITTTELERSYVGVTSHNLGVIESGNSAIDDREITAAQYESVMNHLHEVFPLAMIDTGNSMTSEVFSSVLDSADQVVLVGLYGVDASITAADTLSRIRRAGGRMEAIANGALVSITRPQTPSPVVNVDHIRDHFINATSHGVVREIPFDPHLNEGGVISLDQLRPDTRREFMVLSADIVHALAGKPLFSSSILPQFC